MGIREIKVRYVFKDIQTGSIEKLHFTISEIETNNGGILDLLKNPFVELISRDEFTGLNDKNGVEIYEGDILSNSFMDSYPNMTSQVVWDDLTWCLKVGSSIRPMADNAGWSSMSSKRYGDIEVIGNIYENPELLNGAKA